MGERLARHSFFEGMRVTIDRWTPSFTRGAPSAHRGSSPSPPRRACTSPGAPDKGWHRVITRHGAQRARLGRLRAGRVTRGALAGRFRRCLAAAPASAAQPSPRFTFLNRAGQLPLLTSLQLPASAVHCPSPPGPPRIDVGGLEGGPARGVHPGHDKSHWRRRAGAVLMRGGTERERRPRKRKGGREGAVLAPARQQLLSRSAAILVAREQLRAGSHIHQGNNRKLCAGADKFNVGGLAHEAAAAVDSCEWRCAAS